MAFSSWLEKQFMNIHYLEFDKTCWLTNLKPSEVLESFLKSIWKRLHPNTFDYSSIIIYYLAWSTNIIEHNANTDEIDGSLPNIELLIAQFFIFRLQACREDQLTCNLLQEVSCGLSLVLG
ncbi:CLUMA_CG020640, isoform A [Clunio marinus]|uniref:CLUMA_CG020640, isoform A n=1 Tax=Clunio marinus TaxID=568069 RepID=A0A1J1J5J7_9DIPT|nr:CLUMA_CG020640, isoform A [Clunio marinus]